MSPPRGPHGGTPGPGLLEAFRMLPDAARQRVARELLIQLRPSELLRALAQRSGGEREWLVRELTASEASGGGTPGQAAPPKEHQATPRQGEAEERVVPARVVGPLLLEVAGRYYRLDFDQADAAHLARREGLLAQLRTTWGPEAAGVGDALWVLATDVRDHALSGLLFEVGRFLLHQGLRGEARLLYWHLRSHEEVSDFVDDRTEGIAYADGDEWRFFLGEHADSYLETFELGRAKAQEDQEEADGVASQARGSPGTAPPEAPQPTAGEIGAASAWRATPEGVVYLSDRRRGPRGQPSPRLLR